MAEFYEGMTELLQQVVAEALTQIRVLRIENATLKARIDLEPHEVARIRDIYTINDPTVKGEGVRYLIGLLVEMTGRDDLEEKIAGISEAEADYRRTHPLG